MKWAPGALFSDQVLELTRMFSQWNACEQTVVLYALLRRVPVIQARFLAQAVDHNLPNTPEMNALELAANNPAFINSLITESTEVALNHLLKHLPLLRASNVECKQSYLAAIPELVNHCSRTGMYIEQAQQLLGYTLIHPALSSHDRRGLTQWLRHIEDRISNTQPTPVSSLDDYSTASNRWDQVWTRASSKQQTQLIKQSILFNPQPTPTFEVPQYPQPISRQRRSNSLTPPVPPPHPHEVIERNTGTTTNHAIRQKPRSFSVSGDNSTTGLLGFGPLSPQSSCASSGSEGRLDETVARTLCSGMRDVPGWLKTLRLHKYSYLFATMSYEDMLELTEDQLADQGVTKGARHKLALSITKLQQRLPTLVNLEKELLPSTRDGNPMANSFSQGPALLVTALDELNTILTTPLKPSVENDPQDIPAKFVRVVGKLCSRLALESVDDGVLCGCINILEKVQAHDCFTHGQKEKVKKWRSRLGNPRPTPKWQQHLSYNNRRYCNTHHHNHRKASLNIGHIHNTHQLVNSFMVSPHRNSISTPYLQQNNQINSLNQNNLRPIHATEKRPSLQETSFEQMQITLQRTYSAPRDDFLSHIRNSVNPLQATEPEIDSRLESLCLRMTEQAIGGFGEA